MTDTSKTAEEIVRAESTANENFALLKMSINLVVQPNDDLLDIHSGLMRLRDKAQAQAARYSQRMKEIEAELLRRTQETNEAIIGFTVQTRWNKGKSSVDYDEACLYSGMDDEERKFYFTMTPSLNKAVFAAALKSGLVPKFARCVKEVPAKPRWVVGEVSQE